MARRNPSITFFLILLTVVQKGGVLGDFPMVVSTWPFKEAVRAAWKAVDRGLSALDAVVVGCSACEELRCDGTGPMNLSSTDSMDKWMKWRENSCQPNFRENVFPIKGCGPYSPISAASGLRDDPKGLHLGEGNCGVSDPLRTVSSRSVPVGPRNHDTISMTAIDKEGHIAVGTSTNGATFKIPGRVGDGPIAGSAAYADDEVGACGATGDGDIMMRFLPW
ncbi:probable isoaspartyl peptidase/L-asparaginase 3 isoform X3 [Amborella trichopoda]|uniref:probable isoaspartyl peptidase/L-asparaginase 3 isoform X3 n=1 Tax=Amborella trichopoda TaxID=13333 RepID=UPI0009C12D5F|nr:probable isoaspartyl peptidase/L-asparaginase 3 isoform X3 [Amborella trichopoda]|eukprot:XP_020528201.1 probable isoaspartyl peptidase/L-asparaginase 3 isoform X3 [Amborella trichopoda]